MNITDNHIFVIAEAGVNHNGSVETAFKLVDAAVNAGADAVKFQTWKTELLVTRDSDMAEYQKANTGVEESQFAMLKKLELNYEDFKNIKEYCDSNDIVFISTPDEIESAKFLNTIQDIFKIGSGELTNIPYLTQIGAFGKPVILSTGMGTLDEVSDAIDGLMTGGLKKDMITLLHAVTSYPAPIDESNLRAMETMRKHFGIKVGYSDHTTGINIAVAATALGASVIEKHFTLDKEMQGPDHKASLNPTELESMVKAIREVEKALGNGTKAPSPSETDNMAVVRKSIVASCNIASGEVFTDENITLKRPGTGLSPSEYKKIIGMRASRDFAENDFIEP